MAISLKKLLSFLVTSVTAVIIAVSLGNLSVIQEIENRTWDWRVKLSYKNNQVSEEVRLIEVDQRSLDEQALKGYTWPWPRSRYSPIIKFLELAGAKGLAFDILFTEGSSYGEKDDRAFSDSLRTSMPILQIAALTDNELEVDEDRLEEFAKDLHEHDLKSSYSKWYASVTEYLAAQDYNNLILPIQDVLLPSQFYGNASVEPDSDGIIRHYTIGGTSRGMTVLNSPFAFYDLVSGGRLHERNIGNLLDENGRLIVKFKSDGVAYRPVSADAIITSYEQIQRGEQPMVEPAEFKGAWVYLGLTAPGLFDLKPTPLDKKGKAVEFLATVLDNILTSDFVQKAGFTFDLAHALILSLLVGFVVFYLHRASTQFLLVFLFFVAFAFIQYYSTIAGYMVSFVVPFTAGFLSLILSLSIQYYLEGRQHRFIRNAFRYYVSETLIDKIVENPDSLSLGGERRELTVFFSDIAGFTGISEKLEPSKLVSLMNSFLSEMTGIIQANKGTVDKYIGDAIVAFWNAPLAVEDHAYLAVQTALDCQKRLQELSKTYLRDYGVDIKMRVGINTAFVNVGNFGSRERFSYTVIGDGVNLASRLEGVNKIFSTFVLITKSTLQSIEKHLMKARIAARKIADIKVVGKSESVEIYEPIYEGSSLPADKVKTFNEALAAFYEGNSGKALELFKSINGDPVSQAYIIRLESELNKGEDVHWSPVWALTSK